MYSYLDESFDEGGTGVFVVGGLLMRGVPSFELERKWEKLRKRPDITYFKASECKNGRGEFAEFVANFYRSSPKRSISSFKASVLYRQSFTRSFKIRTHVRF